MIQEHNTNIEIESVESIESVEKNFWPHWRSDLFDIQKIPFSCAYSFLAISTLDDGELWLRSVRGGDEHTDAGRLLRLRIKNVDASSCIPQMQLTPDCLRMTSEDNYLEFIFADGDTILVRGQGLALEMTMQPKSYDYVQDLGDRLHISHARQDLSLILHSRHARTHIDAPWQGMRAEHIQLVFAPDTNEINYELQIHAYRTAPSISHQYDFDATKLQVRRIFSQWLKNTLPLPDSLQEGRLLAAYITWSCLVPADGALSEPAMYMSKNWMTNIWSWDHCFNALALARHQPELAWQQMKVIYDAQHESGRLPDFINDNFIYWRFTKPPVHGWTFAHLRSENPEFYNAQRCQQVIDWLSKQVDSWMQQAINGLPNYNHGNDAGWDNSTVFLQGTPLSSPDLASFLILQMREIATLALHLQQRSVAENWMQKAQTLQDALLLQLWNGERFIAKHAVTQKMVTDGNSLIRFMPLLLGKTLPETIRSALLADLRRPDQFITAYGAATEAIQSPWYASDGYWRGPIWAPVMALLCDALYQIDEFDLARQLATAFTTMANRSGMAENYDALTGAGLRDPAFTWTSSVFLRLANQLHITP